MNIIKSSEEIQNSWIGKRDRLLEEEYSVIASGIPLVDIRNKKAFYTSCQRYFEEIISLQPKTVNFERWDQFEIDRMFGKGLNPTSLKAALNDIQFFVKNLNPKDDSIRVIEFGPGSGWSTLMLHDELRNRFPNKKISIISVDLSPHSIAATENSLDYYQIPWQTILEDVSIEKLQDNFTKITLILSEFITFMKNQPDNYFDGYFSSHGTAYLSKSGYEELMKTLTYKGKEDSIFVADSLDPLCAVNLSTIHLLQCSLFPNRAKNMKKYYYGKSSKSNSKYFAGQEVKSLIKVNNKESLLFYNWNNRLIKKLKFSYLIQMMKSIKITTDIINEYIEDVYPSYLIKELKLETDKGKWEELSNLPEVPLYISNAGFRLKKS
ncbi:MAG: hypothetical protein PHG60_00015 [Candidatus Dojkabacteria bacterium]|jgi:hypothetical protein|nr:hypothetical protein [Candidatus Dojkabacteria bacterium]